MQTHFLFVVSFRVR